MSDERTSHAGPVFDLRDVHVRRDGRTILEGVNWTIGGGDRWVVLGPNGAGKTTLLRLLSTYLVASSGQVEILGRRVGSTNLHAMRPRIGYLSPALAHEIPEQLSPHQIVDAAQAGVLLPWYVERSRMSRPRTEAALDRVGLAEVAERAFATFSSGEQLRIQLARALVTEPRALLLDEPTASLDIGGRESLIATLSRLAEGPTEAIVAVLHRPEDVPPGFTHALLLRAGRVLAVGPIGEVVDDEPMSACFGVPLRVVRREDRLAVQHVPGRFGARGFGTTPTPRARQWQAHETS